VTSVSLQRTAWPPVVLGAFRRRKTALLTTYRRDGTPVSTPVTMATVGDRLVFRTYHTAGTAKRLARDPSAAACPATFLGRPQGEPVVGRARRLTGPDEQAARVAIAHRSPVMQGLLVPLGHRLRHLRTLHYELDPA
jgi:hypothetical protein